MASSVSGSKRKVAESACYSGHEGKGEETEEAEDEEDEGEEGEEQKIERKTKKKLIGSGRRCGVDGCTNSEDTSDIPIKACAYSPPKPMMSLLQRMKPKPQEGDCIEYVCEKHWEELDEVIICPECIQAALRYLSTHRGSRNTYIGAYKDKIMVIPDTTAADARRQVRSTVRQNLWETKEWLLQTPKDQYLNDQIALRSIKLCDIRHYEKGGSHLELGGFPCAEWMIPCGDTVKNNDDVSLLVLTSHYLFKKQSLCYFDHPYVYQTC